MKITRKPPRFHQDNALYFLTFCTHLRFPLLHHKDVPEMLIENLLLYSKHLEELIAYTVMPNHIHLLVSVKTVSALSIFLRDYKRWTAREIKRMLQLDKQHIWQRGTMDHCIRCSWTNKDFSNHVQYLFSNSLRHLGIPPRNFPYHNFSEMVVKGWLDDDFFDYEDKELFKRYET